MKVTTTSKALTDLTVKPGVRELMTFDPTDGKALSACCETILARDYDRDWLADTLCAYNQQIGNDEAALNNAELLRQPDATLIVTGQQAGMFTGPLYTVIKAATAVKLAAQQTEALGKPVIPIFWSATEDHDLSEIASCFFPGREWRAELPDEGRAAERLPTAPALELARQLIEACSDRYQSELTSLLTGDANDYGSYSSGILARLFAGTGLIIMEPRLLRPKAADFLQNCVRQREQIREALKQGTDALKAIDVEPSFQPGPGFGVFHIGSDGVRRQMVEKEGKLLLDGEPISADDLIALIGSSPEEFSTGAYLRPVLQTLLLPNTAFVAGPGELKYHLQLGSLYELFDATMPVLRLRNHATILGPIEQRTAEKLGLDIDDYFRPAEELYRETTLPEAAAQAFEQAQAKIDGAAGVLTEQAEELVGDRAIANFRNKSSAELQKVQQRALREFKRAGEVDNGRIDRFCQAVFPGGPQERKINVFYFLQYAGPALIQDLIASCDPDDQGHVVLSLD